MSEMAPEHVVWPPLSPRVSEFKDPCPLGCGHQFHGLPCVGVTNYRDTGPGCDCPGPYHQKEAS